jgi:hypothetical protein
MGIIRCRELAEYQSIAGASYAMNGQTTMYSLTHVLTYCRDLAEYQSKQEQAVQQVVENSRKEREEQRKRRERDKEHQANMKRAEVALDQVRDPAVIHTYAHTYMQTS